MSHQWVVPGQWTAVPSFCLEDLAFAKSPFSKEWLATVQTLSNDLRWQQPISPASGKPIQRHVAWLTAPGYDHHYKYAQLSFEPCSFPDWFVVFQAEVFKAARVEHFDFNSCNVNWYANGKQFVGWHADDEELFGAKKHFDVPILSLSIGESRVFQVRCNKSQRVTEINLDSGDLMFMGRRLQMSHEHQVPPDKSSGPRLNFTWRHILDASLIQRN